MTRIRWYGPTLLLLVTMLTVMVAGPSLVRSIAHAQTGARIQLIQDSLVDDVSLRKLSEAFRKVAEVVEPSVVHIQIYSNRTARSSSGSLPPGLRNSPFREFFREFEEEDQVQQDDDATRYNVPQVVGNGSGWIYDHDGHIITNYHVIEDSDGSKVQRIAVKFHDGAERDATVVGYDKKTDIAVLKVQENSLHPATLAEEPVQQGDIVFAFGSPYGFEFSMSQGVVSAKGRRLYILGPDGYENFIQTDAAINRGNSGGPLTNIFGQVVGMNSAIATRNGASNGLGFAIPTAMIRDVVDQILDTGKVSRGYLGIYIKDLNQKMAETFGFSGKGVLVEGLIDGPATEAGVLRGDIITRIDGNATRTADELRNMVARIRPGTKVEVELYRLPEGAEPNAKAQPVTLTVTIGELPDSPMARSQQSDVTPDAEPADAMLLRKLGLDNVRTYTEEQAERAGREFTPGVLIGNVRPGSAAQAEGLTSGLIITEVMGIEVTNVDELIAQLNKLAERDVIRLSVTDGTHSRFVFLEVPRD